MLLKSKRKHIQSIGHQYYSQSIKFVEIFENIDIYDFDNIYNNFIKEHNQKNSKIFVKCQFNFHFDNCLPGITSALFNNETVCDWKNFLLKVISDFIDKGYKFSHISRAHIITHNLRKDMTYHFYMSLPMSAVEQQINLILHKNPHLINSFCRTIDHPMIRKFSYIPQSSFRE